jgi:hypothetical protein
MQNALPLPINDSPAFAAIMKVLAASNPLSGLWSLPFKDKLRVLRVPTLANLQARQKIRPYQQLRYWSNVPFRHGPTEVVQYCATPSLGNPARLLQRSNPKGLQHELIRHINEDGKMSSFDFGVQLLDADRMTYWGKRLEASFWIENASVKWKETERLSTRLLGSPFYRSRTFSPTPAKSPISMSRGIRHLTARPLEVSIALARSGRPLAEKRACASMAIDPTSSPMVLVPENSLLRF